VLPSQVPVTVWLCGEEEGATGTLIGLLARVCEEVSPERGRPWEPSCAMRTRNLSKESHASKHAESRRISIFQAKAQKKTLSLISPPPASINHRLAWSPKVHLDSRPAQSLTAFRTSCLSLSWIQKSKWMSPYFGI
jgi:hypothetical protein